MTKKDFEKELKQQYQITLALVPNLNTWRDVAKVTKKLERILLLSAATQVFHTAQTKPAVTITINNLENQIQ